MPTRTRSAPSVLVVEDDALIALNLQHILESCGLDVCGTAATRREAVDLAARTRPAFAMMDMRLADGSNGLDTAAELLHGWGIRSLFISGNLDEDMIRAAEPLNPLGFVGKPFSPGLLVRTLSALAERIRGGDT